MTKNFTKIRERHPEPQFARENILSLDGEWQISFCGDEFVKIKVPYCPESELSGIGYTDFIRMCEYRKTFICPKSMKTGRTLLRFGAVNHFARVFVNDRFVGGHEGGYTPFYFDVTDFLKNGENKLAVFVENDLEKRNPSGKQSRKRESFGCFYTRCTGIWQSVWLEAVPDNYLLMVRFYPNIAENKVVLEIAAEGEGAFSAEVYLGTSLVGRCDGNVKHSGKFTVNLSERRLWTIGDGVLYDVCLSFGGDMVYSYFGLREVGYDGYRFLLNGQSVFQRLVLDQGYYEKGVYTPESDTDFVEDIERARRLGFNGARLHQKVFAPGYLYECDKRGFLVWGEYASWGIDYSDLRVFGAFADAWREAVERDFNHPCIVTWCPLNEAWGELEDSSKKRDRRFIDGIYAFTKVLDPTRPCVDVSGGMHATKTDIADFHCYDGFDSLKTKMEKARRGDMDFLNMYLPEEGISYSGEPQHLSEFGGVTFGGTSVEQTQCVREQSAWGYSAADSEEAFITTYENIVCLLLGNEKLSGFCYTQLYDIEQEQNGLFRYDRKAKFSQKSMSRLRLANETKAVIEK